MTFTGSVLDFLSLTVWKLFEDSTRNWTAFSDGFSLNKVYCDLHISNMVLIIMSNKSPEDLHKMTMIS